ncbi:MAG: hypothetical protein V1894_03690 [Chloroflexota bacterium]
MDNSEFMAIIENTQKLLRENTEWQTRWAGFATDICSNKKLIESIRSSFREWSPLYVYVTTTSAKNAPKSIGFDLRYMGQAVAKLTGNKDGNHKLSTKYTKSKSYDKSNLDNFGCNLRLSNVDWRGDEATEFRNYFNKRKGRREGNRSNDEHRLESLILTEFFKTESKDKALLNVQPVTPIKNVRFPMPTNIKASNHKKVEIGYGHIDILTRVGRGRATHLCIMELKDVNKSTEPPKDTVKQAVAYTTFIRELLRSDSGKLWWKLFGFSGEIPNQLVLYAACVMPPNNNNDYSFGGLALPVDRDTIVLHYLYFKEENNKLKFLSTSIPGIEIR